MKEDEDEEIEADYKEGKRGQKRKFDTQDYSDQDQEDDSQKENMKSSDEIGKLTKAKNVGILVHSLAIFYS